MRTTVLELCYSHQQSWSRPSFSSALVLLETQHLNSGNKVLLILVHIMAETAKKLVFYFHLYSIGCKEHSAHSLRDIATLIFQKWPFSKSAAVKIMFFFQKYSTLMWSCIQETLSI